ncbi:Flagellar biosynthesis protein FlhF, partial [hydrothermal vent metagenome]
ATVSGVLKDAGEAGFIPTPPWFQPAKAEQPEPPILGQPVEREAAAPSADPAPPVGQPSRPPADGRDTRPTLGTDTQAPPRLPTTRVAPAPTTPTAHAALEEELAAIRRLVGQVLQSSRRAEARVAQVPESGQTAVAPSVSTGPIFDLYMRLLDNQTSTEVADDLTSAVRDDLTASELSDAATVRDALLRHLAKRIAVAQETQPPTRTQADRPTVVALIGPTGVGKTTTVAKLAATYKLRHGRKVGLVTADTYRIAAVEQLRTYADIVGLPLKVALSPQDMTAAIEALSDCDIVMVDTAGRSQHDAARLDELGEFLDAARPDTTHLVLSLAAAESVIYAATERFGALNPGNLILSKLDEAVDFGVIANIAARVGVPISHITTGQEVPDHIEPANADRLARFVLDGQAAWAVSTRGV